MQSNVGVFVRKREREKEREKLGQSMHSSGESKESVFCMHRWRQCGG